MRNRKGFADIVLVFALAALGVMIWQGPRIISSLGDVFHGGSKNQKKQVHTIDSTRIVYQIDPKHPDRLIPVKETYKEEFENSDAQQPPETLWQKFLHLGIMIIPVIALISYLGAWPLIYKFIVAPLKAKIAAAEAATAAVTEDHDALTQEARKIVLSIDHGLVAIDSNINAANAMASATLDPTVKTSYTTIAKALLDMKQDFLTSMSKIQDGSTKALVSTLKNR